jgi:hypothetical protein
MQADLGCASDMTIILAKMIGNLPVTMELFIYYNNNEI